jgi:hypothetical protein
VVAALAAQAGVVARLAQRRRITAGRPLVEDLMQVGWEIVGEFQRARHDGVFDGFLAEWFFGTVLQNGKQIVFHCAHNWR